MTTKRLLLGAAVLAMLHNALRLLANMSGVRWGIFNYLHGFKLNLTGTHVIGAAVLAAVVGAAVLFACLEWNRPRSSGPMLRSIFWTVPTAALMGLFIVMVSTTGDHTYGWLLFVLVPFFTGFQATLALSRAKRITLADALVASALTVVVLGALLLAVAVEGVICLVMAAPLALVLALLGGIVGYWAARWEGSSSPAAFLLLTGLLPFGSTVERTLQPPADVFQVTTSIDLAAAPERVWQIVLQPARLSAPTNPLLRSGIGYPRFSHIEGTGAAATRYCDFSTGKLVEPVLIWDEPRQLRFRVASNPIPMQEWTPYAQLHPPHLDGFLVSKQGEFRLIPLPGGGTRLLATTWYQHHLWPEQYWRGWSDYIIHRIHEMVLDNIRQRLAAP